MPTIIIGEYYKYNGAIYLATTNRVGTLKLKEVLAYNSAAKKWVDGSGLSISPKIFNKVITEMINITKEEFKNHFINE